MNLREETCLRIFIRRPKESDHMEDIGINGSLWHGLVWLRLRTAGSLVQKQ
jgi:hypothetical protein